MTINSEQYPHEPFQLAVGSTARDLIPYEELLKCLGDFQNKSEDFPISPESWSATTALFAWNNIASSEADESHMNPRMTGTMRFRFEFEDARTQPLKILVFGEFPSLLTVHPNKSISYE